MIYGIPNFKLEKEIVNRRAKLIRDSGVNFEMNFEATLLDIDEDDIIAFKAQGVLNV